MKDRIRWYRRRKFYGALTVALIALAVPVSLALAGSGGSVTVQVQRHNEDCGDDLGGKIIGKDTLRRSGDTLYISHKVSGADPGKHYYLSLWDGTSAGCTSLIADLGKFKVDSNGSGSKNATADVSGTAGVFLVCDYNNDTATYDCSIPLVQLGPDES
jgi:hypothetical protein